jgi:flagellar assembly protein FliH
MATVIRSAKVAGKPFLLAKKAAESQPAEAVSVVSTPAARPEANLLVAAPKPSPAPVPPESVEQAPPADSKRGEAAVLSLNERDRLLREEIEVLRKQVLERARQEGYEAGLAAGEAAFSDQIESLRHLARSAEAALSGDIHGFEDVLIDIAFEAVCRIIGRTLATPEGVASVIREVIREVRGREQLLVRLSPQDLALLGERVSTLLNGQEGLRLEFVADERVALGGCIVEVAGGTLDGRLETQLKQLSDTLLGVRRIESEIAT